MDYDSLPKYERPEGLPEAPPSIDDVPIYRREWAASLMVLGGFCVCPPALWAVCVLCLTGDIYRNKVGRDGRLARWHRVNKVAAVVLLALQAVGIAARLGRVQPGGP